jgi:cytochrome d ubiquinol oxidase subunit I
MAMWMLLLATPVQMAIGDLHGLNTLEHQPAKIAAMEGHWRNEPGAKGVGLKLFGWPDMDAEETRWSIEVPRLGSLILTHSLDGTYPGLSDFPPEDRPPSYIVFWTFRVMVGLGVLMLMLALLAGWQRWRGGMYRSPFLLRFANWMGPAGVVAILAGWLTTEVGRQPWVVYGVMRTKDAVSGHSTGVLALTLGIFVVVYLFVFGIGIRYLLALIAKGPEAHEPDPVQSADASPNRPARPLSAVPDDVGLH